MTRDHKTARISTGGYYPPRAESEDGAVSDWDSEYERDVHPAPVQAPVQLPSPTPALEEEEEDPEEIEPVEEDEEETVPVIDISSDEEEAQEEDVHVGVQHGSPSHGSSPSHGGSPSHGSSHSQGNSGGEGGPNPPMGWIMKDHFPDPTTIYSKFHYRLVRLLVKHYSDWEAGLLYVCTEYRHPLQATYWRAMVVVTSKTAVGKAAEMEFFHPTQCATMRESIDEAALGAWVYLRGYRPEAREDEVDRYLPVGNQHEEGWTMENAGGLVEPAARQVGDLAVDLMHKCDQLREKLHDTEEALKKMMTEEDDKREARGEARLYDKFEAPSRP